MGLTVEEAKRRLFRMMDRRLDARIPKGVTVPIRGTITEVFPADRKVMARLRGSTTAVPVAGVPALPVPLTEALVGTEAVFDKGADGWLMLAHLLGLDPEDPDAPLTLPFVTLRASGGDDLGAFNAAVADAAEGTTIYLPDPLYMLSDTWHIAKSNIAVVGTGAQLTNRTTTLRRITNTGGAVVRWGALDSEPLPLATWPVQGGGMTGITLNANGLADFALHLRTMYRQTFRQMALSNSVVAALNTDTLSYVGSTSYNDVSFIQWEDLFVYVSQGIGIRLGGNPTDAQGGQNTYGVTFTNILVNHGAGATGLQINNVDDGFFYSYQFAGAGTLGIELNGSNGYAHARNCHFFGGFPMSGSKTVIARATGFSKPSRDNLFIGLGNEDTTGTITVEPGAMVHFIDGRGRSTMAPDPRSSMTIVDDFVGGSLADENIGELGWGFIAAAPTRVASPASHPGVRRVGTSAVAATLNGLVLPKQTSGNVLLPAETFDATFIFALRQTDADTMCRVGFMGNYTNDPPAEGIYLEKVYGDTVWNAVCRTGSVQTREPMSAVAAFAWVRLRIRRRNSTTIVFSIGDVNNENGTEVDLTVPTGVLNPVFQIKNQSAVNKELDVGHFMLHIIGLSR